MYLIRKHRVSSGYVKTVGIYLSTAYYAFYSKALDDLCKLEAEDPSSDFLRKDLQVDHSHHLSITQKRRPNKRQTSFLLIKSHIGKCFCIIIVIQNNKSFQIKIHSSHFSLVELLQLVANYYWPPRETRA